MSEPVFAITNATVIQPETVLEQASVVISGGQVAAVFEGRAELPAALDFEVDARGAFLMPGIIDLHNDSLETEINPRPGANLPIEFAFATLERRLLAAGVTVEFHAISFMNMAKSGRSIDQAAERAGFVASLQLDPTRVVDHRVLHRLDVWNPDAMNTLFASVRSFSTGYVSLNDHTPGQGQYRDVERYTRFMREWRTHRGAEGIEDDDVAARIASRAADSITIPMVYGRLRAERELSPFVLASHGDDSPEKVDRQWEIGATIAEFPVTVEAARRARERGMTIVVGAPNIVRGGSTSGNQDARELFALGLADVICADYHAPSLLASAFSLADDGTVGLPAAIRALTLNPARALGMERVGAIVPGHRADILLVRKGSDGRPAVERVYRAGTEVFSIRLAAKAGALA